MPSGNGHYQRLDSWKDIAAYLRRDVRTAIRWEKEKGLPVHRVPGGRRQAVFAYAEELDAWLIPENVQEPVLAGAVSGVPQTGSVSSRQNAEGAPFSSAAQIARRISAPEGNLLPYQSVIRREYWIGVALAAVLSALAILGWRLWTRAGVESSGIPVRVGFTETSLEAFDDSGRLLWTHKFAERIGMFEREGWLADRVRIADFRGEGEREVLAIIPLLTDVNSQSPGRWEVDLFSSRGELLWSYVPQGRFQFGKHELDGPWLVFTDYVSTHEKKTQIWVVVSHAVWGNTFVVNLDPLTGRDALRFVNTGTVHALNEVVTPQATYLLVGGFNNEEDTGGLAVIDEAKPFAASPQSAGSRHRCLSCPAGNVEYYFVFPRSEINELEQVHEDAVMEVRVAGDEIEIRKKELEPEGPPQSIYLLKADSGVHLVSQRFESTYDMLHRKLEQEGKLRHTLEQCPERLHPRAIQMWTPAGGWTELRLDPGRGNE